MTARPLEPLAETEPAHLVELTTLYELSETLACAPSLHEGLGQAMRMLSRYPGALRGALTLLDDETGELYIEAHLNLPDTARLARYRLGEGITGEVVATGRAMVVPDVEREPRFLHRTVRRIAEQGGPVSFVCVPILLDHRAVGAISVDLPGRLVGDANHPVRFLSVVSALVALALRTRRPAEAVRKSLEQENQSLKRELRERYDFNHLIGTSNPMRELLSQIAQVSATNTSVLLRGESGTGKELVAHAIHYNSARAAGPFIRVNCAALPETLMESELFGHERGAFTGALARKKGRFELAHGGTLFLDEIGELSLTTQAKLLRVLQEREFERVGGTEVLRVDVRLVAATNRDLEQAIGERRFRDDLYYRLNVFPLFLPPLRERKPDILLLADHFVEKYARAHQKPVERITTPAIDMLVRYHWPGNVRELENVIERAVVVCDGTAIHGRHLPPTLQTAEASGSAPGSLKAAVSQLESDLIQDALKSTRGSVSEAARMLTTTERILRYKIRKYRITPSRFS
ncbi:MAG TPA: sigma 54-interacting transcriptional regulator [Gemmatimonadales bacterium]|nr:sigma 54-interacting transcriptional regulator [Gemmatimonadales bacterium]